MAKSETKRMKLMIEEPGKVQLLLLALSLVLPSKQRRQGRLWILMNRQSLRRRGSVLALSQPLSLLLHRLIFLNQISIHLLPLLMIRPTFEPSRDGGIRTSITGLKHLYLAHELGEPTNLGIAKPTPDETDSSTSGCSTCWLVT